MGNGQRGESIKRALRAIYGLFHATHEPDSIDETREERNCWGYPIQLQ